MWIFEYLKGIFSKKHRAYYYKNGKDNEYYVVYVEKEWFSWHDKQWWILLRKVNNHQCVYNWPKNKLKADPAKRNINYEIKRRKITT